jgi:hypothetical protein
MTTDNFWKWFEQNSARLDGCDTANVADELESAVSQVDPRLGVEVADIHGKREVIITANGDRDAFSVARSLVAASPPHNAWKFIGLKPPRGCKFRLEVNDFDIQADRCLFDPLESEEQPNSLGLRLFFPSIDDPPVELDYPARLIVETTVGEELATRIGYIDVAPWRERGDALAMSDMHNYVKWFFEKKK